MFWAEKFGWMKCAIKKCFLQCRGGSFGIPFQQQDAHYKPPSCFTGQVLEKTFPANLSKSLTFFAAVSTRNETEIECSMRLMLLGEINPDPHARVVGFRATCHAERMWCLEWKSGVVRLLEGRV